MWLHHIEHHQLVGDSKKRTNKSESEFNFEEEIWGKNSFPNLNLFNLTARLG